MTDKTHQWQLLTEKPGDNPKPEPRNVWRYAVPGGWIYLLATFGVAEAIFVPAKEDDDGEQA